jgi:hypothetical protein
MNPPAMALQTITLASRPDFPVILIKVTVIVFYYVNELD